MCSDGYEVLSVRVSLADEEVFLTVRDGTARRRMRLCGEAARAARALSARDMLTGEQYAAFSDAAGACEAEHRALAILAAGDNSRLGLYRKLISKGVSPAHARQAVTQMQQNGYIREEEALERLVPELVMRRLWGPRRVLAGCAAKGYEAALVRRVMHRLAECGEIDFDSARRTLLARCADADEAARYRLLQRYGY